tara:strand:- start:460 stop:747 length:288 start_codon:yes stop_codon:yes gene_type:complete
MTTPPQVPKLWIMLYFEFTPDGEEDVIAHALWSHEHPTTDETDALVEERLSKHAPVGTNTMYTVQGPFDLPWEAIGDYVGTELAKFRDVLRSLPC